MGAECSVSAYVSVPGSAGKPEGGREDGEEGEVDWCNLLHERSATQHIWKLFQVESSYECACVSV